MESLAHPATSPGTFGALAGRGDLTSAVVWSVGLLAPLSVLATAAALTPDPAGHGTHMQLGLPPCGFYAATGYPCPGCGLTTAFANMIRLQVVDAAHANPFGVMLFLVTVALVPLSSIALVRRMPVLDTLEHLRVDRWAILLATASVLVWTIRVATQWLLA